MMLRLLFRFFGVVLLLLTFWGSLWAGFQNFNLIAALGGANRFQVTSIVLLNYGFAALSIWMLRGGPKLIREQQ